MINHNESGSLTMEEVQKEKVAQKRESEDENEQDDESDEGANEEQKPPSPKPSPKRRRRRSRDGAPISFPQKLMSVLSNNAHADIISWLPHGRGFMIYQKKRFAAEVLPKYFKQSKFTSFTRKLNRWNFTRITRGPETGAYYHEFFQRGNLRLCMQMSCQNPTNQHLQSEQAAANQALVEQPTITDPNWGVVMSVKATSKEDPKESEVRRVTSSAISSVHTPLEQLYARRPSEDDGLQRIRHQMGPQQQIDQMLLQQQRMGQLPNQLLLGALRQRQQQQRHPPPSSSSSSTSLLSQLGPTVTAARLPSYAGRDATTFAQGTPSVSTPSNAINASQQYQSHSSAAVSFPPPPSSERSVAPGFPSAHPTTSLLKSQHQQQMELLAQQRLIQALAIQRAQKQPVAAAALAPAEPSPLLQPRDQQLGRSAVPVPPPSHPVAAPSHYQNTWHARMPSASNVVREARGDERRTNSPAGAGSPLRSTKGNPSA